MKINEAERVVGISKKNIRFYEEEGLLHPQHDKENGYRSYSAQDILTLKRIKLLRQLAVPIDQIRGLLEGRRTLAECMRSHSGSLEQQRRSLEQMQGLCLQLAESGRTLDEVDADAYGKTITRLEEGGIQFMNVNNDKRKRSSGSILAAAVIVLLALYYGGLMVWAAVSDPIPAGVLVLLLGIPLVIIVGVLLALRQRLKEIEKGEEDEARKY